MTAATANNNGHTTGAKLAERLGLNVIKAEGHDLLCKCPACPSSDAFHLHQDDGRGYCFSCGSKFSPYALAEHVLNDTRSAVRLMVDLGIFEEETPRATSNGQNKGSAPRKETGNGKPAAAPVKTDEDAFLEVCQAKRMPPDAVREFGGRPHKGGVLIPMMGPDRKPCSTIHITPANGKGMYAKGHPTGIFLPGRWPAPEETWLIVEGAKDAAALFALGNLASGLPSNRMNEKFAPLFQGCDVIVLTDGDAPGREGGQKTAGVLKGVARSVKVASCPDGKDARDVIATDGPEGIGRILIAASNGAPSFTQLATSAELLAMDLRPRFFIRGVLVALQPCVIGGRGKAMKTSIATDLVVSLGSGSPFLGEFATERVNVAFWSGESGAATIRETAQRIAVSKGVNLADCSILWSFDLPKLCRLEHLKAMADTIKDKNIAVAVIDPLYLTLLSAETANSAGNLFAMGAALQPLAEVGRATNCTFVLLHHFRKNSPADDAEPASLEELAQAGVGEWARQWILLQRRSPYQHNGRHELWARIGGSAGHGGLYGVDIEEGTLDPDTFEGRKWDVAVRSINDTREEVKREKENRKAAEQERRDAEYVERVWMTLGNYPNGETEKTLRAASRLNPANFGRAILTLEQDGRIELCDVPKGRSSWQGWRRKSI